MSLPDGVRMKPPNFSRETPGNQSRHRADNMTERHRRKGNPVRCRHNKLPGRSLQKNLSQGQKKRCATDPTPEARFPEPQEGAVDNGPGGDARESPVKLESRLERQQYYANPDSGQAT